MNRTFVRNICVTPGKVSNMERHNERQKDQYVNEDIVPERTALNVHFKEPDGSYQEIFDRMVAEGAISTRGLKADAKTFGELIFDVNSAYFDNHGGYEFAKQFYEDAYKAAVEIVGGEEYILSAVMHADERNRGMSEALGRDVYHYHLHVVYIPVVEKEIRWSKRCKDPALVGTVKERIHQVSSSKKWASRPAQDEQGRPLKNSKGKPVLKKSYSVLQDDFYQHMLDAGYTDILRGERGSTETHLTVTQFKVQKEQQRLEETRAQQSLAEAELAAVNTAREETETEFLAVQAELDQAVGSIQDIDRFMRKYGNSPEEILPETTLMESAKKYRKEKAVPIVEKFMNALRSLYARFIQARDEAKSWKERYEHDVPIYKQRAANAQQELTYHKEKSNAFDLLSRVLGTDAIEKLLKEGREKEISRKPAQKEPELRA